MVGQQVAHYIIEAELGQGGMGVVYKARDTMLERTVALKFLPPMFSKDEQAKARFTHEARAVSALDHPNVAVVHEIGSTEKGEMFIVMAFYNGRTLEDIIAEGPVSLDDTVSWCLDIARGLAAAHDKGIIHRDIKPGNIMVTEAGFLKILDFGLAKVQDVTMTMGAMSLGTLAYMSPEQAQGVPVDNRTDLWALGVVMYEMLAGKRPFDGPYDAAILYAAANTDHERVSVWRADAPAHLAAIVDKLLQKMPEQRYQDAHELIADLEQMRAPMPSVMTAAPASAISAPAHLSAGPAGPSAVSGSGPASVGPGFSPSAPTIPLWKRPVVIGGAVVLGLVGAGGVYWAAVGGGSDGGNTEVAQLSPRVMAQSRYDNGIEKWRQGDRAMALRDIERATQEDPTFAPAWMSLSAFYYQTGDYGNSVRTARRAIELNPAESETAFYNLGLSLAEQNDSAGAIEALESAIRADTLMGAAYSALGDILTENGQAEDALMVLRQGSAVASSEVLPFIYKNEGKALLALGRTEDAITRLRGSLNLNPGLAESALLLARAYDSIGQRRLAREQWETFLQLERTDLDAISEAEARLLQNP